MSKAVPPLQLLPDFMKSCSYLTTCASLKPAAKSLVIFSVKNKHFTVGKILLFSRKRAADTELDCILELKSEAMVGELTVKGEESVTQAK